jgi:hypothetical protein
MAAVEGVHHRVDVQRRGVMEESVKDCGGEHLIVEDLAPLDEAPIARHDETAAFVSAHDQSKEEAGFFPGQAEVAELVENQQPRRTEVLEGAVEPILMTGFDQPAHETLQGQEQRGVASLDGFDAERNGHTRLPDARGPNRTTDPSP